LTESMETLPVKGTGGDAPKKHGIRHIKSKHIPILVITLVY
jgi:hypothetical protein